MSRFRKLVENILHNSLDEDAKADHELFQLAYDAYGNIVKKAKKKADEIKPTLNDDLLFAGEKIKDLTYFEEESKYGPFNVLFDISKPDALTNYSYNSYYSDFDKSIVIRLCYTDEYEKFIIHNASKEKLQKPSKLSKIKGTLTKIVFGQEMYDLTHPAPDKADAMKVDNYIDLLINSGDAFNTFIHEFTHYVDTKKHGFRVRSEDEAKTYNTDDRTYYRNGKERNAYYMAGLHTLLSQIMLKYKKALRDTTPEERLAFFKEELHKDKDFASYMQHWEHLNPKEQKLLLSRIYSFLTYSDFWK